jgi:multiple sugar transport system permease protein
MNRIMTTKPSIVSQAKRQNLRKMCIALLLLLGAAFMILPFALMISTSFKPFDQVFLRPFRWIPRPATLNGYRQVWSIIPFWRQFANTAFVATSITLLQLATSILAAYAFARLQFPGRDILFLVYLAAIMVPSQVTMIPLFMMVNKLGWLDTYTGLIIPFAFNPFATFLLRQFFVTIPKSLEEAAVIDGCTRFDALIRIIVPLSQPAIATASVLAFMFHWNNFLWPLIVTRTETKKVLTVGLATLQGQYYTDWPVLMAGVALAMLPIVVLFLFSQRYFMEGIALTGIKE